MGLNDLIREIREKAGLNRKEFAEKLGYTDAHIGLIEKPFSKTGKLPSEELLRKIASRFSYSEEERITIERKLLLERAKLVVAPEVSKHFLEVSERVETYIAREGMPLVFIERLKQDIESVKDKNAFFSQLSVSREAVEEALQGRRILPRKSVIELAVALGQSIEEYLVLADYMPEEIKSIVRHEGVSSLFRTLGELTSEELDEVIDVVARVLKLHRKK